MDDHRFDALAKTMTSPGTRRGALGALAGGGLLAAFGRGRAPATAQGATCTLSFVATIRQGPSARQTLTPGGAQPGVLQGELSIALADAGAIDQGSLRLPNGTTLPVVGQATGRSLQLRLDAGQGRTVVVVGVGAQAIADCQGAVDGLATGPQAGDLGDWHATVKAGTGGSAAVKPTRAPKGGGNGGSGGATGGAAGGAARAPKGGGGNTGNGSGGTSGGGGGSNGNATGGTGGRAPGTPSATTSTTGSTTTCPTGQTSCTGTCVDLTSDPNNCGACGKACPMGQSCAGSACAASTAQCAAGQTSCAGACVDLTSDPANCSACGIACNAGDVCRDSLCVPANGGGGARPAGRIAARVAPIS